MKLIERSLADTKKTQWEDPRLQNVAITGPVSFPNVDFHVFQKYC